MTRITNFGRKRTYVEAGFHNDPVAGPGSSVNEPSVVENMEVASKEDSMTVDAPPKKKRKRTKKPKPQADEHSGTNGAIERRDDQTNDGESVLETNTVKTKSKKSKDRPNQKKDKKSKAASWRAEQSELRRQQRISERQADTTCFACRKKGHAARDCPISRLDDTLEDEKGSKVIPSVGICYRCGSTRHTLSRCKKPSNPSDPLPFAACFVCHGKGHLASSCPQNKAKGIYPKGGSCKLCGETSHLAKNCDSMKNDANGNNSPVLFSPTAEVTMGADEDDFHTLKRRTVQIERNEKKEEKAKRMMDMKAGAHSGVVKAFGKPPVALTKKVVYF